MAVAKKFSALTAVDTPVGTAQVAVNEGGTTKRMTVTQVVSLAGTAKFELVTASDTIEADERFSVDDGGGTVLITITATIAALEEFIIHNESVSSGTMSIEPNTGHTIKGPLGDVVGGTDTLVLAAGETVRLLAVSSSVLEII